MNYPEVLDADDALVRKIEARIVRGRAFVPRHKKRAYSGRHTGADLPTVLVADRGDRIDAPHRPSSRGRPLISLVRRHWKSYDAADSLDIYALYFNFGNSYGNRHCEVV